MPDPTPSPDEGLDVPAVTAWMSAHVPSVEPPVRAVRIAGGRSNLTFLLHDAAGQRMVLRRPPVGHVLQSAHDMGREHRIIKALGPTAVPVPRLLGLCEDPGVTGAPFYVMAFVDGAIVHDEAEADELLPESRREAASDAVVGVLADLHTLDPTEIGLGDLGRHESYVERQLRRWARQWQESKEFEVPAIDAAHGLLAARVPPQQRVSIVHGDFRIDNLVLDDTGAVIAVLDWELCTLGDPLADVGTLLVSWAHPGEDTRHLLVDTPTTAPGFRTRGDLLATYARRSGLDLSRIDFYVALSLWKLACIAAGIYARTRSGAMGSVVSAAELSALEDQTRRLAERALQVLSADSSSSQAATPRVGDASF